MPPITINASGTLYLRYSGGSVQYSTDNSSWTTVLATDWPVTINNTNVATPLIVQFPATMSLNGNTQYFICGSDNIQFGSASQNANGIRSTIAIIGSSAYPGLIQNGTSSTNGKNNISIYNLILVISFGTVLTLGGGWIGQAYFARGALNNTVTNCSSAGNNTINKYGGGILGRYVATNNGSIIVTCCTNGSSITYQYAGGIVGSNLGEGSTNDIIISRCYSFSTISQGNNGYIVGSNCAGSSGNNIIITNCYSVNSINANKAGGIIGENASYVTVSNCHSYGALTQSDSGCIFGYNANNCTAQNCYSAGSNTGSNGIFEPSGSGNTTLNCYVANGNWDYDAATAPGALTGVPTTTEKYGTTWAQFSSPNSPFQLSTFGYSTYSLTLTNTFSQSIIQGNSSSSGVIPGYTYSILEINDSDPSSYPTITINSSSGAISTTTFTPPAVYTIIVREFGFPYSVTPYTLTVAAAPIPAVNGTIYFAMDNGQVGYSTVSPTGPWDTSFIWPATITTTTGATVIFASDITLTANDQYFICGSDNIQFGSTSLNSDGTRPIITISGAGAYPGLIQNGTLMPIPVAGNQYIYVYNLVIDGSGATLLSGGGWIGQSAFSVNATDNYIINCTSIGAIPSACGGIVGEVTASNNGSITIIGCNSSGDIEFGGGGITGYGPGATSGIVNISQCFSTGNILQQFAGGIVGDSAGNNGQVTISNCYSIGDISGEDNGGIVGDKASNVQVIKCYSKGIVSGLNAGGIFGQNANNCTATNCYSAGSITGSGAGGIFGPSGNGNTTLNCYAANGAWSDVAATANLQNIGWAPGNVWGSLATNTPYVLVGFGASPYTLDNIDTATKTLVQTFSQTIQAGSSTPSALAANYKTFAIEAGGDPTITIATTGPTGIITTTTSTPAGTYTLFIYAVDDYTTTTYVLTVTAAPTPPTPAGGAGAETTVPPCCEANICNKNPQESNYSSEIIATKRAGKTLNTSVANFYNGVAAGIKTASRPLFKSYYEYMVYLQGKTR